ncbi:putative Ig domain-containing protein [Streptomyces violascens]|uniref:putative Ig domain-containing protein n=1 Tax=Streptomyces violascens TaxID=67381 RepID=UPI003681669F
MVATQPPTATAAASCASLAVCYNNVGISADNESSWANFDGDGNSYAASALADAATNKAGPGAPIISSNIRFTFPKYGKDANGAAKQDNLVPEGQTINLPPTAGATKLGFLLSGSWGSRSEDIKINYTDSTVQSFQLYAPDWQSPSGGTVAINSAYRNTPGDNKQFVNTYIYSQTVDLDATKTAESVTLPASGPPDHGKATMHIFGIATGNAVTVSHPGNQSTQAGTPVNLQIQASDTDSGQALTYSASGLPSGLSIDAGTGLISGAPVAIGTATVTVTATDTTGSAGSATFSWTVTTICQITYTDDHTDGNSALLKRYSASINIKNISNTPINGWTLRYTYRGDQRMVAKWSIGGDYSQSGKDATITNYSFQPTINPGSTSLVTLVLGYWTNSYASPTSFTLNGILCKDNIP